MSELRKQQIIETVLNHRGVASSLWPGSSSSSPPSSIFQKPCGTLEFVSFHHLWRLSLQTPTAVLVHVDVWFTQQRPGGFTHNGRVCARGLVGFWHTALTLSLSRWTDTRTEGNALTKSSVSVAASCTEVSKKKIHTWTSCEVKKPEWAADTRWKHETYPGSFLL